MLSIWLLMAFRKSVNVYVSLMSGDLIAFVLVLINFNRVGFVDRNHVSANNSSLA